MPAAWNTDVAGFYYVDNTHAAASDSVDFGTPARPRRSIPPEVPAGSVVEVHGGPYLHRTELRFGGQGTADAPVFYRGVGAPKIQTEGPAWRPVNIRGEYVVVEGFDFINSPPNLQGRFLVLRDNEARDRPPAPGGAGVYAGSSQDSVVLRNHIHNNGDPGYHTENDIHGVHVAAAAQRVWILDNHMHHNGGDSVQVNSGRNPLARSIYIGRNRMHDEGENAVDIKTAEDVIVSQNEMYGFRPTKFAKSGSDGSAVVLNDDNIQNGLDNRIWIIFNNIHDSRIGIRTQAHGAVIGNLLQNIPGAGVVSFGSHNAHIEHNTFRDVDVAVHRSGGAPGFKVEVVNNLITGQKLGDVMIRGNAARSSMVRHNPRRSTAGVDTAEPSAIYARFAELYRLSIAVDRDGRPRPANGRWAVGAQEPDAGRR